MPDRAGFFAARFAGAPPVEPAADSWVWVCGAYS
jgi:hypothetical protein